MTEYEVGCRVVKDTSQPELPRHERSEELVVTLCLLYRVEDVALIALNRPTYVTSLRVDASVSRLMVAIAGPAEPWAPLNPRDSDKLPVDLNPSGFRHVVRVCEGDASTAISPISLTSEPMVVPDPDGSVASTAGAICGPLAGTWLTCPGTVRLGERQSYPSHNACRS